MAANDYLMRQIEDMARFLGKVLFVKTEETIPLFDEQDNVLESGLLYKRLCAMLEEGDANSAENLLFDEVEAHPDPAYLWLCSSMPICSIGRTRRWKRLIFPVRRFWTALQP